MRVVFMGTPDFAVPCLEALIERKDEIAGVFTQPDKPVGRGHKLKAPPVKELAASHGIPVFQPPTLKDAAAQQQVRELAPELIVVVAYGKLLPKAVLDIPPLGCINVHGSLLPKYRGAAPIQWAVLNGEKQTGVSTMFLSEGMDCGDVILERAVEINEGETSGELFDRLAPIGAGLLRETIELIASGSAPRRRQDESQATLAPMITKDMARLDFTKDAAALINTINGMNPWPVAHTAVGGAVIKVYRARAADAAGAPGEVLDGKRFVVACKGGALELLEIQAQGGKRMAAADYLRGHPVKPGTIMGS